MPPSSTPACCTFVIESDIASADFASAGAAAGAACMAPNADDSAARRSPRCLCCSDQVLNNAASSASDVNGLSVFFGAVSAKAENDTAAATAARMKRDLLGMDNSLLLGCDPCLNGPRPQRG